ncbi:MAG: phosphatase PAP2 family protein [Methanimicrococcus sp.]|nr:phosphatase PAP2 family protein [Methanimicrococcus sp.]
MNPFEMIQSFDLSVILWIFQTGGNLYLDRLAIGFHWAGTFRIPAIILGICLWFKKETRPIAIILLAAVLATWIVTFLIKELVHRPRPYIMLGLTAADMLVLTDPTVSFPSGHTSSAFASATVISYFFRKWVAPALTLALMAGLARIYLLVHYPSDVAAGAFVGIFAALTVIYFAKKLQENERFAFLKPDLKKDG